MAFFGDILLRLPEISQDIVRRNREWDILVQWGVGFCEQSQVFQGKDRVLLDLVRGHMCCCCLAKYFNKCIVLCCGCKQPQLLYRMLLLLGNVFLSSSCYQDWQLPLLRIILWWSMLFTCKLMNTVYPLFYTTLF